jgi:predicted dehydrogenase
LRPSEPIQVAIVGYGYWGRNYARVLGELDGADVAAICDERLGALDDAVRKLGDVVMTTTLDDILAAASVDAVVVCTPASSHYGVARRCLEAGKHILVEKPLTTSSQHAMELAELAEERGRVLLVGHTFLYNQGVMKLKECIASSEVGQMYYMYARRTNLGPIRMDVNALWDLAPHDVAIFNHLIGSRPIWVSAVGARLLRNHLEDVGFVTLAYPRNVLGHIHVSWSDPNKVRELVVVGSQERVVFNDLDPIEQVRIYEKGIEAIADAGDQDMGFGEQRLLVRDGDIRSPRLAPEEPLKRECVHFLECIESGAEPLSGAQDGLDVICVMEAIDTSLARHGAPVPVEQPTGVVAVGALE